MIRITKVLTYKRFSLSRRYTSNTITKCTSNSNSNDILTITNDIIPKGLRSHVIYKIKAGLLYWLDEEDRKLIEKLDLSSSSSSSSLPSSLLSKSTYIQNLAKNIVDDIIIYNYLNNTSSSSSSSSSSITTTTSTSLSSLIISTYNHKIFLDTCILISKALKSCPGDLNDLYNKINNNDNNNNDNNNDNNYNMKIKTLDDIINNYKNKQEASKAVFYNINNQHKKLIDNANKWDDEISNTTR